MNHSFPILSPSRVLALLLMSAGLAACGGQSSDSAVTSSGTASGAASLSGSPSAQVAANSAYTFRPASVSPAGTSLLFSIQNKPVWANFSLTSGELSGTPSGSETGEYSGIQISATDGSNTAILPSFAIRVTAPSALVASGSSSTTTPASSSTAQSSSSGGSTTSSSGAGSTGSTSSSSSGSTGTSTASSDTVSVSWQAPTENTNGSAITNLAGYTIYFGTSASSMTQQVNIATVGELTYVISNLGPGTWYFEVVAVNTAGVSSAPSSVVSVTT
jgi:hypothetical protein